VPLLFLTDGDRFIVIASYGGRDDHPDWYLNLVADPRVTVQIGSDKRRMSARTATAEERSRWWPEVIDAYDAYAVYQRRTERQIPVVVVEPAGGEKTTDNLATDVDC
jgi:deazaflavin-dependent oxidoreductase (nitroreductase family)